MPSREPFMRIYIGPGWAQAGWIILLQILPRSDLMQDGEEAMMRLVGFELRLRLRSPWGRRTSGQVSYGDWEGWRWPMLATVRSDVGEIASRLADRAQERSQR